MFVCLFTYFILFVFVLFNLFFIYLTERLIDYLDSLDGSDWAERNKILMRRLVDELTEKLPEENVVSFSISWKPEGKQ